jgi:hypothetical protein
MNKIPELKFCKKALKIKETEIFKFREIAYSEVNSFHINFATSDCSHQQFQSI